MREESEQMKVDPSILYRILYDPRGTLREFTQRPRYEVVLPVIGIALLNSTRAYLGMPHNDSTEVVMTVLGLAIVAVYIVFELLLPPLANAVCAHALRARLGSTGVGFRSVSTAFVLCALPLYLGIVLSSFSPVFWFSLGTPFRFLANTHPSLFFILGTITPYFLWMMFLWWIAVDVVLRQRHAQRLLLVGFFAVLYTLIVALLNRAMLGFIHPA